LADSVSDLLQDLGASVSALGGNWTKYSVVGSFVLYLFGYLAVRFHLTAIGIGTDLAVLDERYLFAGARIFVYLVSSVPSILLILLPIVAVLWGLARLSPATAGALRTLPARRPAALAWSGVVVAVVMIQFVMRQCFLLSNLLLAPALPSDPSWLVALLFGDQWTPLFFAGLMLMCGVSVSIWIAIRHAEPVGLVRVGRGLLAFLVVVQILLLPVNYGILIMDRVLPRVVGVPGDPASDGDAAWLVWEGKDGVTFLVRHRNQQRVLLTLPRADVKRIEIVGFDPLVPTLFGGG
jgi:hypothetical protein